MTIPEASIKAAKYSNVKRAKVSAIAFSHSGEIIATAHNRRILGQVGIFTQHAETNLIHKLNKLKAFNRFKDITILVLRISSYGITMAKPCSKCQNLLRQYPVNVSYSGWDGQIYSGL